jgi:hypothetical protein
LFTFDDLYYINGGGSAPNITTTRNSLTAKFGTFTQFSGNLTAGSGVFQGNGTCVLTNCLGSTNVQRIGGRFGDVSGEFVLNNSAFTNEELTTNGFTATTTNGNQVGSVFNSGQSTAFLRDVVGGATQIFTFNSFVLSGSGTITFRGELNLNPVAGDLATINLTSTPMLYTFNWAGIDTVDFFNGFINSDQVTMDNVTINVPVATPEPTTLALLGSGLLGSS